MMKKGKITNQNEICMKISHGSPLLCKLILKIQKEKERKSSVWLEVGFSGKVHTGHSCRSSRLFWATLPPKGEREENKPLAPPHPQPKHRNKETEHRGRERKLTGVMVTALPQGAVRAEEADVRQAP